MLPIDNEQHSALVALAIAHKLDLVVLFGSVARGKTHKHSDIDIAIKSQAAISYYQEAQIRESLCKIFNTDRVEVRQFFGLPPLVLRNIARDGKVLYQKSPQEFCRFQMYAFKLFVEAKPLFKLKRLRLERFLAHAI